MDSRRFTPLELSLVGVAALVLLVAALVDSRGGAAHSRSAPSGTIKVGPIVHRVERLRGLRFRRPLAITFASPARARSILRSTGALEDSPRAQRVDEEELKLLGLLDPSDNLQKALRAVTNEEILGFYDPHSKRLVVIRQKSDSHGLQEITLAHELVHALEDQHFRISEENGVGDDRALAEEALHEGTATAVMSDYADRYLSLGDLLGVVQGLSGADTKLPKFIETAVLFPYLEGERFVETFRQGGSWGALDKVLRIRQPRSTEQVLHPERYAIDEKPIQIEIPDVGRSLGGAWKRTDSTNVGEFDLRAWFRQVGKVESSAAAAGWGGGQFQLWRRGSPAEPSCSAPCIGDDIGYLRLAWDTRGDRAEGEAALRHVFERGLGGRALAHSGAVGRWSSRGGSIGLTGRGRETTVVFAPAASLTDRLLALR